MRKMMVPTIAALLIGAYGCSGSDQDRTTDPATAERVAEAFAAPPTCYFDSFGYHALPADIVVRRGDMEVADFDGDGDMDVILSGSDFSHHGHMPTVLICENRIPRPEEERPDPTASF